MYGLFAALYIHTNIMEWYHVSSVKCWPLLYMYMTILDSFMCIKQSHECTKSAVQCTNISQ